MRRNKGISPGRFRRALALLAATALTVVLGSAGPPAYANEQWVVTWSTALLAPNLFPGVPGSASFDNVTLRQIIHTSVGGERVRVKLSTFGSGALTIGSAYIARRDVGPRIMPGTDRMLTFGGQSSITIPSGASVLSDPVYLYVPPLSDLAVSIFVSGPTGAATWHHEALQTSYVSLYGDFTSSVDMEVDRTTQYRDARGGQHDAWYWLAGVEVAASSQTGTIVAFGDSVTDGTQTTPGANSRWPDQLARRIMGQLGNNKMGVVNLGVAGNKLLNEIIGPNALARFDQDVLVQTGVTDVIVLMGNNDILFVLN